METLVPALATALLHSLWQGAALALLAALAFRRCPRAATRHTVAGAALALAVLLPLGTFAWRLAGPTASTQAFAGDVALSGSTLPAALPQPALQAAPMLQASLPRQAVGLWAREPCARISPWICGRGLPSPPAFEAGTVLCPPQALYSLAMRI